MNLTPDRIMNILFFFLWIKIIAIGDFSVFIWIRYGKEYRTWYMSRETFGQYLKRTNGKKGW